MRKLIDTSNYNRINEKNRNGNCMKRYICEHCKASFMHIENFDLHYKEYHKPFNFFKCC